MGEVDDSASSWFEKLKTCTFSFAKSPVIDNSSEAGFGYAVITRSDDNESDADSVGGGVGVQVRPIWQRPDDNEIAS